MIEGFKEAVVASGASMSKDPELRREIKKAIVEALKGKRAMREPVPDYWNRIKVVNGCAATSHAAPGWRTSSSSWLPAGRSRG